MQEDRVDPGAQGVVAAECERHVAHAGACAGTGEVRLDPTHCFDEIGGEGVVPWDAGSDGEDVGVDDYASSRKAVVNEEAVAAPGYFASPVDCVRLTFFVEAHDHSGSA